MPNKWDDDLSYINNSLNSVSYNTIDSELGSIKLELDQLKSIVINNHAFKVGQAGENIRVVTPGLRRVGI